MQEYLKVWQNYFNFSGRSTRRDFWVFVLMNMVALAVVAILDNVIFGQIGILYMVYALAVMIPTWAVIFRRLHDAGKSGWYIFMILIPIAGPILYLVKLCKDSEVGTNKWGVSPKYGEGSTFVQ